MRGRKKEEIITFKVDERLSEAMEGMPNRSDFIRKAILSALNNLCPLCHGTGVLSPDQRQHWREFSANHRVTECQECHAFHLVCENPH